MVVPPKTAQKWSFLVGKTHVCWGKPTIFRTPLYGVFGLPSLIGPLAPPDTIDSSSHSARPVAVARVPALAHRWTIVMQEGSMGIYQWPTFMFRNILGPFFWNLHTLQGTITYPTTLGSSENHHLQNAHFFWGICDRSLEGRSSIRIAKCQAWDAIRKSSQILAEWKPPIFSTHCRRSYKKTGLSKCDRFLHISAHSKFRPWIVKTGGYVV